MIYRLEAITLFLVGQTVGDVTFFADLGEMLPMMMEIRCIPLPKLVPGLLFSRLGGLYIPSLELKSWSFYPPTLFVFH
jgi:hypothetical protein